MDMKKTGEFIQMMRKGRNLSQRALGEHLSVTDKAVSKWERGLACPDIENLKRMALLFGCNISEIVNGETVETGHSSNLPTAAQEADALTDDYSCDVSVQLDCNSTRSVSPLLFGDNLEHTRDCVNGGISAQMLRNRKFVGKPSRYGCALEWYPIGEKPSLSFGEPFTRHYEGYKMKRKHECNAQVITNYFGGKTVGIGQKGLSIKAGTEYEFSLVSHAFCKTKVTVALTSSQGKTYDAKEIVVEHSAFCENNLILTPDTDDPSANLEITFAEASTVTVGVVSLMPRDHFHGMRRDVIEKMKEIGIKLLRWPGGNFAGEYHWKDGLLPRDERAPFQSYLGLETQPHTYGYDFHEINTDDFIALCREIDAQPFITINPTWNTPEESAQWVEYCNGDETTHYGKKRAERGNKHPYNVLFWSLGNEFGYGHMEGANQPADYAKIVERHAEECLKISPNITLCSSGPYPDADWVNHSAKVLKRQAPIVSLHHYAAFPSYIDPTKRKEEYYNFIDRVHTEFLYKIRSLREMLGDDSIKISFDEWNAWYAWYRGGSVSEGIFTASFMNMLFQNADRYEVAMACHFESVNEGAMQVYPDEVRLTPTGQVFSVMKHHANGMIRALQPDVIITEKDNILNCTFINRSFDKDKKFILLISDKVISATLFTSDDVVPHTVFEEYPLPVKEEANSKTILLPGHSLAFIQIQTAK